MAKETFHNKNIRTQNVQAQDLTAVPFLNLAKGMNLLLKFCCLQIVKSCCGNSWGEKQASKQMIQWEHFSENAVKKGGPKPELWVLFVQKMVIFFCHSFFFFLTSVKYQIFPEVTISFSNTVFESCIPRFFFLVDRNTSTKY